MSSRLPRGDLRGGRDPVPVRAIEVLTLCHLTYANDCTPGRGDALLRAPCRGTTFPCRRAAQPCFLPLRTSIIELKSYEKYYSSPTTGGRPGRSRDRRDRREFRPGRATGPRAGRLPGGSGPGGPARREAADAAS